MRAWMNPRMAFLAFGFLGLMAPLWLRGQQPNATGSPTAANGAKLTFDVVQSFDAKYEGDTPGHLGRAGGLQNARPNVALNDPIFRGDAQVGKVTALIWNRTNGSLDIEFDPVTMTRVAVGDEVWLKMAETHATPAKSADKAP